MKWYVYLISCGIIVPLVSCLPCCIGKPKHILWAPLLNFVLFILVDALFYPFHLEDIFSNNIDFTTGYWFWFFFLCRCLPLLSLQWWCLQLKCGKVKGGTRLIPTRV